MFNLMPRNDKFFDLFELSAQNMVRAAESLKGIVYNSDEIAEKVDRKSVV